MSRGARFSPEVQAEALRRIQEEQSIAAERERRGSRAYMLDLVGPADGHPWSCACLRCTARRDAKAAAKPHGPAPKRTDGYRSKAEADYAAWLNTLPGVSWSYERVRVAVEAAGCHYTPDFVRTPIPLGAWERLAVEVKGQRKGRPFYRKGDRRRALDGAAALWSLLGLPLFVAWKVDGVFRHERVEVRS